MNYFDLLAAKTLSGGGVEPTGTLNITANGNYDVTQYAEADVAVPTSGDSALIGLAEGTATSAEIPNGATKIGQYRFAYLSSLTSVTIPSSVRQIQSYAFYACESLDNVVVPGNVNELGDSVFSGCSSLKSVLLSEAITTIPSGLFYNCRDLRAVDIPELVTSIGTNAFRNCTSIGNITVPERVTRIGTNGFSNCTSLSILTCKATTPPTVSSNTFDWVPSDCAIYVPAESVEAYKAAGYWSTRAAYIQAIPSA